jgi:hypothetical protein
MNLSPSNVFNRLFNEMDKCCQKICFKSKTNESRQTFPRQMATVFAMDIKELIEEMNNQYGSFFQPTLSLANAMTAIGQRLRKKEGIDAFASLLGSLKWMIQTICNQDSRIIELAENNSELSKKLYKLECHIAEYEQDDYLSSSESRSPLGPTNANDDKEVPPDMELLNNIKKAILYANQSKIKVVDCYAAKYRFIENCTKLVILYQGYLPEEPPNSDIMYWKNIENIHYKLDDLLDEDLWREFLKNHSEAAHDLLCTFQSRSCFELMEQYPDITAMFPSVRRHKSGALEPVIVIQRKFLDYYPYDTIPFTLQVVSSNSTHRVFGIVEIDGISYVQSSGKLKCGDSLASSEDIGYYGTIGGVVERNGKCYWLTNEHVARNLMMNSSNSLNLFNNKISLHSPSRGAKRINLMKVLGVDLETDFAKFLLENHSNKVLLNVLLPPHNIDTSSSSIDRSITLKEVADYICDSTNELSFEVEPSTIEYFHGNIVVDIDIKTRQQQEVHTTISISVNGDIALIPVANSAHIAPQSIFPINFDSIYNSFFLKHLDKLYVHKNGATTGITTGYLSRPTHVAAPNSATWFMEEFSGQTTVVANLKLQNQFLVTTDNGSIFGEGGDSGSLVYVMDQEEGKTWGIGIFVGAHPKKNYYVVTPIEFITKQGCRFVDI